MPVNSPRSNPALDVASMNDTLELWSLPWHALLRSLAKGFGAETAIGEPCAVSRRALEAAEPRSWLLRARATAPSTPAL
jgi:hypothetical protein